MLLAKLLLHPNQVVSTEELIEAVWGEEPPPTVKQSLQNHVAALRKSIEAGNGAGPPRTLVTRDPGYLLRVDLERLDLHRFQRLDREGRQALAAGDPARARADLLRQALALWRGPALADVAASTDLAWPELVGVEEAQVASTEARIEAELALGRHHELVAELEALVRLYPLREHLHGQLMLALYRSGRQADALAAYRAARKVLVDEPGSSPASASSGWNRPSWPRTRPSTCWSRPLGRPRAPRRPRRPRPRQRHLRRGRDRGAQARLVLFAEVDEPLGEAGERDPEDVSSMLDRHLDRIRPRSRASAAPSSTPSAASPWPPSGSPRPARTTPSGPCGPPWPSGDSLAGGRSGSLDRPPGERDGVELRIAVTTGEALVTDGTRVAGDLVATCARLQQAAPSGTGAGVGDRPGHRAVDQLRPGQPARPGRAGQADERVERAGAAQPYGMDALAAGPVPLVGRDRELGILLEAFQAKAERRPWLVTLLGPPGIGKSRLVAELGRALDADSDLVTWRGRAAPRPWDEGRSSPGGGVTHWALAEIVKAEAGILRPTWPTGRPPPVQGGRPRHGRRPGGHRLVSGHLRGLVGGRASPARPRAAPWPPPTGTAGATRRSPPGGALYGLANRRPLVLVLGDLHWADDALLDFLQELLDPTGHPTLDQHGRRCAPGPRRRPCCCWWPTARNDLLARRPGWGGERHAR